MLVFDNASEDGTMEALKIFVERRDIIYFRNKKNLGVDANFLRIIEEAHKYSRYSLWLGDDDRLTKDFFLDIPRKILEEKPELLVLNSYMYINKFGKRIKYRILSALHLRKLKYTLPNKYDVYYENLNRFFLDFYDKLSFGLIVVNNSLLNIEKAKRYYGTYHLYAGAIFDMLDEQNRENGKINVTVTAKPYVIWGKGNKSYTNEMVKVCRGIGRWLALLPMNLQSDVYQVALNMVKRNSYGEYTNLKSRGKFNLRA